MVPLLELVQHTVTGQMQPLLVCSQAGNCQMPESVRTNPGSVTRKLAVAGYVARLRTLVAVFYAPEAEK